MVCSLNHVNHSRALKLNSGQSMEVEIGDGRSSESLLLPLESRHLLPSSTLLPNLPPQKMGADMSLAQVSQPGN